MPPPSGYDLEEPLGDGGMGVVYRARQRSSGGRLVALKRVRALDDPSLPARIQREAEILAALDHPHIVRVYEFVPDGSGIAIAMQYAPGGSLADRLAAQAKLDASSVVAFATPIAQALASAHRRGVLHRDVKPGNILFTSDGEPLLSDFGIARWSQAERLTARTGVPLGTAEYLDPHVAAGGAPDERSDVYSLGLVCYEALTGRPPYTGPTPLSVLRATDLGVYTPLRQAAPDCPPAIAEVIERAMARDPAQRFASAAEFATALRRAGWADRAAGASPEPKAAGSQLVPGVPTPSRPQGTSPSFPDPAAPAAPQLGRRSRAGAASESRPTGLFGPRRPSTDPTVIPPARVHRKAVWAAALALLLLPTATVLLAYSGGPSGLGHSASAGAVAAPRTPAEAATPGAPRAAPRVSPDPTGSCPPAAPPAAKENEQVVSGDLDGDGCEEFVIWSGTLLQVPAGPDHAGANYQLGDPGDELLLGDWNCDRIDTPALYRPSTGEVFLYDEWPAPGQETSSVPGPLQAPRGVAAVARAAVQGNARGCGDTVRVTPPAGSGRLTG